MGLRTITLNPLLNELLWIMLTIEPAASTIPAKEALLACTRYVLVTRQNCHLHSEHGGADNCTFFTLFFFQPHIELDTETSYLTFGINLYFAHCLSVVFVLSQILRLLSKTIGALYFVFTAASRWPTSYILSPQASAACLY